jgi:hypothetical protein
MGIDVLLLVPETAAGIARVHLPAGSAPSSRLPSAVEHLRKPLAVARLAGHEFRPLLNGIYAENR